MRNIIQNYNEFLTKVSSVAKHDILNDKIFWNSLVHNKINHDGIDGKLGESYSIEILNGYDTKNQSVYNMDFIVTGVVESGGVNRIVKVFAV